MSDEAVDVGRALDRLAAIAADIETSLDAIRSDIARVATVDERAEQKEAFDLHRAMARDPRPRRLTAAMMICSVPGMPQLFTPIPPEFWGVDGEEAEICCPCGATPRVAQGGLIGCECERYFIWTRNEVMVANGPGGIGGAE